MYTVILFVAYTIYIRKARANILAVEERQSLETLGRDLKTCTRALAQIKEKYEALEQKREKLGSDENQASEKKDEVSVARQVFGRSSEL